MEKKENFKVLKNQQCSQAEIQIQNEKLLFSLKRLLKLEKLKNQKIVNDSLRVEKKFFFRENFFDRLYSLQEKIICNFNFYNQHNLKKKTLNKEIKRIAEKLKYYKEINHQLILEKESLFTFLRKKHLKVCFLID